MRTKEIIAENMRRRLEFGIGATYDPVSGEGCGGDRVAAVAPDGTLCRIPRAMSEDPEFTAVADMKQWRRLRIRHDFEYWGATCVVIKDKVSCRDVRFVLNHPQRRVAALLEKDRLAGRPLRLIMLKARQWGGSTLVQMYMAWIQLVHRTNWNSLICAHVKDTSMAIRGMYERLLEDYPEELNQSEAPLEFKAFGRSQNTRVISGRNCRVTLASAERQDAVRGADYAMAHLSETAFWPDSPMRSPRDLIRAVCGAIAYEPYTLIAMESTANGVGNYFHSEWERCSAGRGDKHAVFVPWYEIEIYRRDLDPGTDVKAFYDSFDGYELMLWNMGLTLEMINWYRQKSREYSDEQMMHAEYPTTADEAFINTGAGVFDAAKVMELGRGCREPVFVGDISRRGGVPVADAKGALKIWEHPAAGEEYIVSVDIGGRSPGADWSVICVLCTGTASELPRVVAQWRGHTDHDLLADRAMSLARMYRQALLVVESNTLEQEDAGMDESLSVLARIARGYGNLYTRTAVDTLSGTRTRRVGFHTNRRTKPLLVSTLVGHVRDLSYIERDRDAVAELSTYMRTPRGVYEARQGCHDDMLMTRALALYVMEERRPPELQAGDISALLGQRSYL